MGDRGPQKGNGGRPKKPLRDKVLEGNPGKERLKVISLPQVDGFNGADMPKPRDYLSAPQKNGHELPATEIYQNTWRWLQKYRCEHLVTQQMIEQYAMAASRWIQCEQAVSEFGFLAKHPTTGAAIASPYVTMAREFSKHTAYLWNQIFALVRDNCASDYSGYTPQDDIMERLLTMRRK